MLEKDCQQRSYMPSSGQKLVDGATLTLASTLTLGQPFEVCERKMRPKSTLVSTILL